MQNERTVAVQLLSRWLETGEFADKLLETVTENRPFVMEVFYGAIKRKRTLDWIISIYAKRKPDRRIIPNLYSAIYQLIFMKDPPDHAIIDDAVESVKKLESGHFAGFLNAVLRKIAREKEIVAGRISTLPTAIRESHPDELYKRWSTRFGTQEASQLCEWNNTAPSLIIRPNTNLVDCSALKQLLSDGGVSYSEFSGIGSDFLIIGRGKGVSALPGYKEGFFSVQDPSTAISVELLRPEAGHMILDACAAPGGKTALISQAIKKIGVIMAMDASKDRLVRLEENIKRLKLEECVRIVCADASDSCAVQKATCGMLFDRVIADVPCSNTGVLRRRPDARWRFTKEALKQLNTVQRGILDSVSQLLKPGGRLVYSTCSLEAEENELLINDWLTSNPELTLERSVLLFPPKTLSDGAFAAALIRK